MENTNIKNGINFKCQGSSNCCVSRGSYGYVYLSKKDVKRLSNFFEISIKEFISKYCSKNKKFLYLKENINNKNCIYLKNKRCNVYKARPEQCRTWPFWPENMNPKKWGKEIVNFCPGIGKGKYFSKNEIKKILIRDKKNSEDEYIY